MSVFDDIWSGLGDALNWMEGAAQTIAQNPVVVKVADAIGAYYGDPQLGEQGAALTGALNSAAGHSSNGTPTRRATPGGRHNSGRPGAGRRRRGNRPRGSGAAI